MKYNYEYICDPPYISISAANVPASSKSTKLSFYINGKEMFTIKKALLTYVPTAEDVDDMVRKYCIYLTGITEDFLQEKFFADEIMGALNINRHLKQVRRKGGSGKVIWKKRK